MVDPRAVDHRVFTGAERALDGLQELVGNIDFSALRGAGADTLKNVAERLGKALEITGNAYYADPSHFIDAKSGEVLSVSKEGFHVTASTSKVPLISPTNGEKIADVPLTSPVQVQAVLDQARTAQVEWGASPLPERLLVLHRMAAILERHQDGLAELLSAENGKTKAEARGEIARGLDSLRFAAGVDKVPALPGVTQVGSSTIVLSQLEPRGVVAGITPFNFPAMIPLWQAPLAIALGNAFVLKPSEQTPLTAVALADMWKRAGLPDGIFSVVHGREETVKALVESETVKAVAFVGSSTIAQKVQEMGTSHGKPVRALGGAKNHMIIMPDADPNLVDNMVGAITGCAGQRCMAASVMLLVGDTDHILRAVQDKMASIVPGKDMGPVISKRALDRITGYLDRADAGEDGTKLLLDGRQSKGVGNPNGFYIGASIIEASNSNARSACQEIFGPVVTVIRCKTLAEAMLVETGNPYGNAVSIYTNDLKVVDIVRRTTNSGMVGVNVGVPVPAEPHGFGGFGDSVFGEGDMTGFGAISLWTKAQKTTIRH